MANDIDHLLTSMGPLCVLVGEVSVQVLCPFFNWIVCLPGTELCEFFIYFADQTLVQTPVSLANIFSHIVGFHFADVFFNCAEAFYFDEVPFVYSFLYVPWSRGHISENIASWNI